MAEWLRRLTRKQMGSTRAGSNPAHDGIFYSPVSSMIQLYRALHGLDSVHLTSTNKSDEDANNPKA